MIDILLFIAAAIVSFVFAYWVLFWFAGAFVVWKHRRDARKAAKRQ